MIDIDKIERAEFEAFANGKYELKLRRSGGYESGTTEGAWRTWQAATSIERERCAKVCDEQAALEPYGHAKHAVGACADAIRKGETP